MNRGRVMAIATAATLLVSCGDGTGGDQPGPTDPGTTVIADPRGYVRSQMDSTIVAYVASMVQQMPAVTSNVDQPEIVGCVKERVGQLIDAARMQPGQPEGDFASMLLSQAQGSLYGLVGTCAQLSG